MDESQAHRLAPILKCHEDSLERKLPPRLTFAVDYVHKNDFHLVYIIAFTRWNAVEQGGAGLKEDTCQIPNIAHKEAPFWTRASVENRRYQ